MKNIGLYTIVLIVLAGCNAVTENTVRANHSFQKMIYNSAQRVQGWTEPHRPESRQAGVPDTRYCYKSMGDIVCYEQPQSNMSNPLFGYQEGYASAMPQASAASVSSAQPVMMVQQAPLEVAAPPSVAGVSSSSDATATTSEPMALMPR